MNRKGNAFTVLFAMIILFFVTFYWMVFSNAFQPVIFPMTDKVLENNSRAQNTFDTLEVAWNFWPLIMLGGLVVWIFVSAQQKEPLSRRVRQIRLHQLYEYLNVIHYAT